MAASQSLQTLRLDVALRIHREFRGVADGTAKVRDLAQARYAYLMAHAGLLALVDGLDMDTLTRINAWFGV